MARTPTRLPARRIPATRALVEVDLPTPGAPVMPRTCARPASGPRARHHLAQERRGVLDQRDEPRDRGRVTLARTRDEVGDRRGAPPRHAAHAYAGHRMISASPWPPPPHRAAAPTPPPRRWSSRASVQHDAGAGHADRVAEGDRAAVDVDHGPRSTPSWRADSMPTAAKASLSSKRSMSEIAMPSFSAALAIALAGWSWSVESGPATWPERADLGEPGQAELLGLGLAHHDHGAGAVGDLRGRAGGDAAVLGHRAQAGERLDRGVAADALVLGRR